MEKQNLSVEAHIESSRGFLCYYIELIYWQTDFQATGDSAGIKARLHYFGIVLSLILVTRLATAFQL
jgi:hypothetical protein